MRPPITSHGFPPRLPPFYTLLTTTEILQTILETTAGAGKEATGTAFLELADDSDRNAYVSCVIWGEEARICKELKSAGFELEPDLQVMFVVSAQINKRGVRVSLQVQEIVADGNNYDGIRNDTGSCSCPFAQVKVNAVNVLRNQNLRGISGCFQEVDSK